MTRRRVTTLLFQFHAKGSRKLPPVSQVGTTPSACRLLTIHFDPNGGITHLLWLAPTGPHTRHTRSGIAVPHEGPCARAAMYMKYDP